MKIVKFINSNKDWRRLLTSPPYNLKIRDDGDYVLIKYNQLFSDFKEQIVREARGIILKKINGKYKIVCAPYTKFFSIGDPNAKNDLYKLYHRDKWHITEKIDGSLIKLWYDGKWNISTNGTIDSSKVELTFPIEEIKTFYDMFIYASNGLINYDKLDKQYTYMFELVGLENKVIVPYEKEEIYYLGRKNNFTLKETPYEEDECLGIERVKRPKHFIIYNNKKELKIFYNKINELSKDNTSHFEGYVISDYKLKYKVKAKSPEYMNLFYKKGNGVFTPKKILSLILENKDDDILASFPEFKPQFDNIRNMLRIWINKVEVDLQKVNNSWDNKKEFAEWAKTTTCPSIIFSAFNNDNLTEEWLESAINRLSIDNLLNYIGVKDNV